MKEKLPILLGSDEVANAIYSCMLTTSRQFTHDQITSAFPQFYPTWVYAALNRLIDDRLIRSGTDYHSTPQGVKRVTTLYIPKSDTNRYTNEL